MAKFCLPQKFANALRAAFGPGGASPQSLISLSSEQRRGIFEQYVGKDNASDVNSLFESKLKNKNVQKGLQKWLDTVTNPKVKKELEDKITDMAPKLNAGVPGRFYEDLAKTKLGYKVSEDEFKKLFNLSSQAKNLKTQFQNTISAVNPNGDLAARTKWGRALNDLRDEIADQSPGQTPFQYAVTEGLGLLRGIEVGVFHFSAPAVQLFGLSSRPEFYRGMWNMMKYFASEEKYQNMRALMATDPDYGSALEAGLGIESLGTNDLQRPENISGHFLENMNQKLKDASGGVVPNIFRASSRGFTGMLNYTRFEAWKNMRKGAQWMDANADLSHGSKMNRELADVVNSFSAYGRIGSKEFEKTLPGKSILYVLNNVLFTPRKMAATLSMMNPLHYVNPRTSGYAKYQRARNLVGSMMVAGALIKMSNMFGGTVSTDPTSKDFMQPSFTNSNGEKTTVDFTSGIVQYPILLSRMIEGHDTDPDGQEFQLDDGSFNGRTRTAEVAWFMRGKLGPTSGLLTDAILGKDMTGTNFNVWKEARDRAVPIVYSELSEYFHDNPKDYYAAFPTLAAFLGIRVKPSSADKTWYPNAFSPKGVDSWGRSTDLTPIVGEGVPQKTDVDRQLEQIGMSNKLPGKTLFGVKLSDEQYETYLRKRGPALLAKAENVIGDPNWSSKTSQEKQQIFKKMVLDKVDKTQKSAARIYIPGLNQQSIQHKQELQRQRLGYK